MVQSMPQAPVHVNVALSVETTTLHTTTAERYVVRNDPRRRHKLYAHLYRPLERPRPQHRDQRAHGQCRAEGAVRIQPVVTNSNTATAGQRVRGRAMETNARRAA